MGSSTRSPRGVPPFLNFGSVMNDAWETLKSNPKLCGFYVVAVLVLQYVTITLLSTAGWTEEQELSSSGWLIIICSAAIQWQLSIGISKAALELTRNRAVGLEYLFPPLIDLFRVVIITFFLSIMVLIGAILLIFPGIYISLVFSQVFWLVIDRKRFYREAFITSKIMTESPGIKWNIFKIYLISGLIFGIPSSILGSIDNSLFHISASIIQILYGVFIAFIGANIYEQLLSNLEDR